MQFKCESERGLYSYTLRQASNLAVLTALLYIPTSDILSLCKRALHRPNVRAITLSSSAKKNFNRVIDVYPAPLHMLILLRYYSCSFRFSLLLVESSAPRIAGALARYVCVALASRF